MLVCPTADSMARKIDVWEEVFRQTKQANSMGIDGEGLLHAHPPRVGLRDLDDPVPFWLAWFSWSGRRIERGCGDRANAVGEETIAIDDMKRGTRAVGEFAERKQAIDEIAWRKRHLHRSVTGAVKDRLEGSIGQFCFFFRFAGQRNGTKLTCVLWRKDFDFLSAVRDVEIAAYQRFDVLGHTPVVLLRAIIGAVQHGLIDLDGERTTQA